MLSKLISNSTIIFLYQYLLQYIKTYPNRENIQLIFHLNTSQILKGKTRSKHNDRKPRYVQ